MISTDLDSGRFKFVGYRIGDTYCLSTSISLMAITSIPQRLSQVPGSKAWLLGVSKLGRDLIPYINIGRFLSLPPSKIERKPSDQAALIVLGGPGVGSIGVVVDEVVAFVPSGELTDDPNSSIRIPPGLGACLCGVVQDKTRKWALIDIQSLVSSDQIKKIDLT